MVNSEKVKVVATIPKPVLKDDGSFIRSLTEKGGLFDRNECLVEDEDKNGYYGEDDIMSVFVFSRILPAKEAVRLAERSLNVKGSSGDVIVDIKYLFKRLHCEGLGQIDFDLYNADFPDSVICLYHSEGPLYMAQQCKTIPNVIAAMNSTNDQMNKKKDSSWVASA